MSELLLWLLVLALVCCLQVDFKKDEAGTYLFVYIVFGQSKWSIFSYVNRYIPDSDYHVDEKD